MALYQFNLLLGNNNLCTNWLLAAFILILYLVPNRLVAPYQLDFVLASNQSVSSGIEVALSLGTNALRTSGLVAAYQLDLSPGTNALRTDRLVEAINSISRWLSISGKKHYIFWPGAKRRGISPPETSNFGMRSEQKQQQQ